MEVHHPHHPTHKKKWSEYIIEFVMLFTAVTLGFFAENVREGLSNREKEKAIVVSLKEELTKDTAELSFLINEYPNKINYWNDSLHYLAENKPMKGNEGLFIQAVNNSAVWQYYSAGEVVLSLTQNTESMNLVESEKLKKQLLEYRKNENFYAEYLKFIVTSFQQTDTAMISIFNLKTIRKLLGKSTLDQLFISSKDIPKDVFFSTYDKNIFNRQLRNIDHADLKITDLKTMYTMMLENEKEILKIIKEEYN